ncbi:MAG: P-II family nitrogen regulator [Tissierellia bacterium]|jgi:nitrogen regulatory protein PII|nr:P-II family nitrogen regulator [Tissierellia bacterium]
MFDVKCIVTIIERGKADKIVEKAKLAGATGASIFYGRGTGESEAKKFLNVHIESSKEMILILSSKEKYKQIMEAIVVAGNLKKPGTGIIFSVPVTDLIGLHHREEFDD